MGISPAFAAAATVAGLGCGGRRAGSGTFMTGTEGNFFSAAFGLSGGDYLR
ncbi:MAG: hypothetical protein IJL80_12865 [Treponema sp.]|nr:hypothetical protein [Treponema sp.]